MSGYTAEDDAADRAYWSDPAHGGAGHEQDNDANDDEETGIIEVRDDSDDTKV